MNIRKLINFNLTESILQYLGPLPKQLLLDLQRYYTKPPALLATDNVVEFRKTFDDSYKRKNVKIKGMSKQEMEYRMQMHMRQNRPMLTGNKKVPVTKPYVEFIMLYDLLKREAKNLMLHKYGVRECPIMMTTLILMVFLCFSQGYSPEMIERLVESSEHSSEWQLHFLLSTMLARNETQRVDIIMRCKSILSGKI